MKKAAFLFALALPISASTHAVQKPEKKWTVKTTTESSQKIWVTRPDGSKQCAPNKGVASPEQVAGQLQAAGILVFQSRSGTDGQMRIQKCGAPTGRTVDLEISRPDLAKALSLGFVSKTTVSE